MRQWNVRDVRLLACALTAFIAIVQGIFSLLLINDPSSTLNRWTAGAVGFAQFALSIYLVGVKSVHATIQITDSVICAMSCGVILNIVSIVAVLYNEAQYASGDLTKLLLFGGSLKRDHVFALFFYSLIISLCLFLVIVSTYALINEYDPDAAHKVPDVETLKTPRSIRKRTGDSPSSNSTGSSRDGDIELSEIQQAGPSQTQVKVEPHSYEDFDSTDSECESMETAYSLRQRERFPAPNAPNRSAMTMTPSNKIYEDVPLSPFLERKSSTGYTAGNRPTPPQHQSQRRKSSIVRKHETTIIEELEGISETPSETASEFARDLAEKTDSERTSSTPKICPPPPPKPFYIKRTERWESIETTDTPNVSCLANPSFLNDIRSFNKAALRKTNRRTSTSR